MVSFLWILICAKKQSRENDIVLVLYVKIIIHVHASTPLILYICAHACSKNTILYICAHACSKNTIYMCLCLLQKYYIYVLMLAPKILYICAHTCSKNTIYMCSCLLQRYYIYVLILAPKILYICAHACSKSTYIQYFWSKHEHIYIVFLEQV